MKMIIIITIIAAILVSTLSVVSANDNGLVVNLASKHVINNDYNYNEQNYGLGYTRYWDDGNATQIGFYDNSYNDLSVYLVYKVYGFTTDRIKPFFLIGGVTGYERGPVVPMTAVGIDVEVIKTHKLNFMIAPLATSEQVNKASNDNNNDYGILFALQYEKLF